MTILSYASCDAPKELQDPLREIIHGADPLVKTMIVDSSHEIQIVYTQVSRDRAGTPHLQSFYINRDDDRYFYPASTIKMPVAFLALQRINELNKEGGQIDMFTRMEIDAAGPNQSEVQLDSSSATGYPNVAHYIEQIFSISDNDAYNRLYEFLGQDYINEQLREKGVFKNSRIRTRVGIGGFDTESNKYTNPIRLLDKNGDILYEQDEYYALYDSFSNLDDSYKGEGYYDGDLDTIIYRPFDMSEKNFINLTDLQASLARVVFPEIYEEEERYNLSDDQYTFLYRTMPKTPLDFSFHQDHAGEYYDSYVKFFYNGDSKEEIPDYVKIFNKVGWAYGTLTDCAYFADVKNNIEFFLSATILVNENGIFNDGQYEYKEKGLPFLSKLGAAVYNYELKRKRSYQSDLSKFK